MFLFAEPENVSSSSDIARGHVRNVFMRKAKRKALRMSIFIVGTFIICWFPYYVIFTRKAFSDSEETYDATLFTVLTTIGQSNAVLNPIIYGAFHMCKLHKPRYVENDIFQNPVINMTVVVTSSSCFWRDLNISEDHLKSALIFKRGQ